MKDRSIKEKSLCWCWH